MLWNNQREIERLQQSHKLAQRLRSEGKHELAQGIENFTSTHVLFMRSATRLINQMEGDNAK